MEWSFEKADGCSGVVVIGGVCSSRQSAEALTVLQGCCDTSILFQMWSRAAIAEYRGYSRGMLSMIDHR